MSNSLKQSFCYPLFCSAAAPGAAVGPVDGAALDRLFAHAAKVGYAATEFWVREPSHDDVIARAKKQGLAIASMCGHKALGDGLNKRENHDRIEAELIQSIDYAVKQQIPGLICFSGNRNPGQSDDEGVEVCAQGLRRIAPYAEKKGINLNVELLNSKVDHPGYQCDRTSWGVALCQKVNSPRVKLLYDIYHMQIMEGDLIRTIRQHIGFIGHFHTAGNPGRNDMDDTQELNYQGICRAIAAAGYQGYLGHEFKPKADVLASLEQAYRCCIPA